MLLLLLLSLLLLLLGCTWATTPVLGDPKHNGLPQGFVLPPVRFNLYSNDLPVTRGQKFIYADDRCLAYKGNTSANWNAVFRQIWREISLFLSPCASSLVSSVLHFCGQWQHKPSASKTISSVFYLHNTSATHELSVYLDGQRLRHESHPTYLGVIVVLQRTRDKDCRQAEEPKQVVDEASQFHLGCQRQHSAVICSGTLLFSSRVLRPSLVTLCSHKSGRCAAELYHSSHLWYPPFYTSPMASSALQH